jgi:hypothetical protein
MFDGVYFELVRFKHQIDINALLVEKLFRFHHQNLSDLTIESVLKTRYHMPNEVIDRAP